MAITNFFDYIVFPTENIRQKLATEYFDTHKLFLDINPFLTLNNLSKKITVNTIDAEGLFKAVNNDLREKVRRHNNDIIYLTISLMKMWNYYGLMNQTSGDDKKANEILFRMEARCVCGEIFMYEEKIKNMIRQIFNLDAQATRQAKDLMKELQDIAKTNNYVKSFCDVAKQYFKYSYVKFVMNIRNDEIHNDSKLDEYTDVQELAKGVISICNPFFIITNADLYNNIRQTLEAQVILKESLQNILNNHRI